MITTIELEAGLASLKKNIATAPPQAWSQMTGAIRIMESLIKISKLKESK